MKRPRPLASIQEALACPSLSDRLRVSIKGFVFAPELMGLRRAISKANARPDEIGTILAHIFSEYQTPLYKDTVYEANRSLPGEPLVVSEELNHIKVLLKVKERKEVARQIIRTATSIRNSVLPTLYLAAKGEPYSDLPEVLESLADKIGTLSTKDSISLETTAFAEARKRGRPTSSATTISAAINLSDFFEHRSGKPRFDLISKILSAITQKKFTSDQVRMLRQRAQKQH